MGATVVFCCLLWESVPDSAVSRTGARTGTLRRRRTRMPRPRSTRALALVSGLLALALAAPAAAATTPTAPAPPVTADDDPTTPLDCPEVGPGTPLLVVATKLERFADPYRCAANVPVVALPDAAARPLY